MSRGTRWRSDLHPAVPRPTCPRSRSQPLAGALSLALRASLVRSFARSLVRSFARHRPGPRSRCPFNLPTGSRAARPQGGKVSGPTGRHCEERRVPGRRAHQGRYSSNSAEGGEEGVPLTDKIPHAIPISLTRSLAPVSRVSRSSGTNGPSAGASTTSTPASTATRGGEGVGTD